MTHVGANPRPQTSLLEELGVQIYLHPEEHAPQRHIVLHQTSKMLVCCSHHNVSPLSVEIFNICYMRVKTLRAPLVEKA